jgi:hypothetical protein
VGYVPKIEDNLIPGITQAHFQDDLKRGSGNELESKFRAVHSSSALVVNTFSHWKNNTSALELCDRSGFNEITFEKQCKTGLGGTPPNIDVLARSDNKCIGVESKFLEYLDLKKPSFSDSYRRERLSVEGQWWELIEKCRGGIAQYLDVAQLIKHYLGLRNCYIDKDCSNVILLYLFWEPVNWKSFQLFKAHRQEILEFADHVKGTSVTFVSKSYLELWDEWEMRYGLFDYLTHLRDRYALEVPKI